MYAYENDIHIQIENFFIISHNWECTENPRIYQLNHLESIN